jgi:hypothetical protein
MAQSKSHLSMPQGWIHDLVRAESHPDAERLLQLGRSFDPQQLVEESTIQFLSELRERFSEYARIFNAQSEAGVRFAEVKVYAVAQTAADFMVFRNQVKLIVSNTAHGVIRVAFAHHVRGTLAVDGQVQNPSSVVPVQQVPQQQQELVAQVGPFRDVWWTFQGEKVVAEQVAKFYFAEFVRATRDSRRARGTSNQVLLDQIKALLQEKGLELSGFSGLRAVEREVESQRAP